MKEVPNEEDIQNAAETDEHRLTRRKIYPVLVIGVMVGALPVARKDRMQGAWRE
jgi:hypothetical protein